MENKNLLHDENLEQVSGGRPEQLPKDPCEDKTLTDRSPAESNVGGTGSQEFDFPSPRLES